MSLPQEDEAREVAQSLYSLIEASPEPGGVLAGRACLALAAISAQGSDAMQNSLLDWAFSQVFMSPRSETI
jgi:hypothetical protein